MEIPPQYEPRWRHSAPKPACDFGTLNDVTCFCVGIIRNLLPYLISARRTVGRAFFLSGLVPQDTRKHDTMLRLFLARGRSGFPNLQLRKEIVADHLLAALSELVAYIHKCIPLGSCS